MKPTKPQYTRTDIPDEIREYIEKLEAEVDRLSKLDSMLGPTIGDNVRLKAQVDTLIHAMSRIVLAEFRHVDVED